MKRLATLTAVLLSTLALPTAALAAGDDPLLSGYGGPGSGDQAVLGGGTIGGGGKGGGSGSSGGGGAGGSLRAATPSAPVTPAPTTSSSTSSAPSAGSSSGKHTNKSAKRHRTHHASTPAAKPHPSSTGTGAAGTSTNLPQLAQTPTRVDRSSAGALPLSTGDLLLALVVALAIAALAVATSRLSRGPAQPSDARG